MVTEPLRGAERVSSFSPPLPPLPAALAADAGEEAGALVGNGDKDADRGMPGPFFNGLALLGEQTNLNTDLNVL
jgi:hypothetical protein